MKALIINGLAVWRLSYMLVNEDGPGAVFSKLRHRLGIRAAPVRFGGRLQPATIASTPLAELFTCIYCLSVWIAIVLMLPGRPLRWLRQILALSAGAILFEELQAWLSQDR